MKRMKRAAVGMLASTMVAVAVYAAKADKPEKPEKPDKPERVEKVPKAERVERSERAATNERPAGAERERASRTTETRPVPASAPATSAGAAFEPFRIVVERNIFNPNRTGRSRVTEEVAPKVEQVALVGTMESEQGRVAFFDSADPAVPKVARAGETVAGFKVNEITGEGVALAGAEKSFALRVNQQLRRVEGGEWRVTGREGARAEAARGAAEGSAAAMPAAPSVPANTSDVLRRLMEQRQKQLKQ